jgi:hypothetical protein
MSVSLQTASIASHQWLQLQLCCHPTKYHLFHRSTTTYPNTIPLHLVKHEVMHAATCIEDPITSPDITIMQSIIQNLPSFLQNTKRAFNVLSYTLQICREVSFKRWILNTGIGTNWRGPAKVAVVTYLIRTSILLHSAICSVIPPQDILNQPVQTWLTLGSSLTISLSFLVPNCGP